MEWNGMEWNGMEWNGMEWQELSKEKKLRSWQQIPPEIKRL